MLEAIRMIGAMLFIISAPIALGIGMYNSYHPEAERKMQEVCERHKKLTGFLILVYVLWSEVGIMGVIAKI